MTLNLGMAETPFSVTAIRSQLERIVRSPALDTSERNRRFLRYVVEETLAGRSDRIKAYTIATSVFDRRDDFDAQQDPIIRIEAGRLRRALEHYYLTAGRDDPIVISIPRGSYVPHFDPRPASDGRSQPSSFAADVPGVLGNGSVPVLDPKSGSTRSTGRPMLLLTVAGGLLLIVASFIAGSLAWWASRGNQPNEHAPVQRGPAIVVEYFEGDGEPAKQLGRGLSSEIIAGLTNYKDVVVYARFRAIGGISRRGQDYERTTGAEYALFGDVSVDAERLRVYASLLDTRSGRHLWSRAFDGVMRPADILRIQEEIGQRIVRAIGDPYAAVFAEEFKAISGRPPREFSSYDCVLRYRLYWRRLSTEQLSTVKSCLERAVEIDPDYADAQAALSLAVLDTMRITSAPTPGRERQLDRAFGLARRAIELGPDNVRGFQALYQVLWAKGKLDESLAVATQAQALNPNNTEILADIGMRYAMRGDWDKGIPMLQEAYERSPVQAGFYRLMTALHHYVNGRFYDAIGEVRKIEEDRFIYIDVLLAISYARLGNADEAKKAVERILRSDPGFADHMVADLVNRGLHRDLIRSIAAGLEVAGLPIAGLDT